MDLLSTDLRLYSHRPAQDELITARVDSVHGARILLGAGAELLFLGVDAAERAKATLRRLLAELEAAPE